MQTIDSINYQKFLVLFLLDYNSYHNCTSEIYFLNMQIWHANMPYNKIADRKGHQGWMKESGPYFTFPGGGTMFTEGADKYIEKLKQYIPINGGTLRTALDMGCGVGVMFLSRFCFRYVFIH